MVLNLWKHQQKLVLMLKRPSLHLLEILKVKWKNEWYVMQCSCGKFVNIYICGLLYFQEATNPPKGHQLKASEPNKKGAAHNWLSRCNLF